MKFGLISALCVCFAVTAMAEAPAPGAAGAPNAPAARPLNPCRKVMEACKTAGYVMGRAKENKGLMKDCFRPLLDGKKVENITIDPADLQACQARMPQRPKAK